MAMTMLYTIVMWSIFGLSFAFGLLSLGLAGGGGGELIASAALIVVFDSVFTMIPAAIGLLGTFQAGCIVALAAFDVSKSHALGFSVVVHVVQFATYVLVGLPFILSSYGGIRGLPVTMTGGFRGEDQS